MVRNFLCWLGVHKWAGVSSINSQPHRRCLNCRNLQALFGGRGTDDWMEVEEYDE
jgi:hypothetical protein